MTENLSKEELLARIEQTASKYEWEYHSCARCVLKVLEENLNLGSSEASRAATALAGGISMRGDTCGALLGALMAISLATATDSMEFDDLMKSMEPGFKFYRKFRNEFGSVLCRELQAQALGRSYSFADIKQYEEFVEIGGYKHCSALVGKASRMAAEYIMELREKEKEV